MSQNLSRDRFTQHLNTQFHVGRHGAGHVSVELVEGSQARTTPGYESFSIVFRGPLGAFELFIAPIRRDDHGIYYEAVFNHIRDKGQI